MSTGTAPRLDVQVAGARRLASLGLAGAVGLAKSRWIVAGIMLAVVGFAIARLITESDEVRLRLASLPLDDEPVTAELRAEIDAARNQPDIPWDQVKQGLTGAGSATTN